MQLWLQVLMEDQQYFHMNYRFTIKQDHYGKVWLDQSLITLCQLHLQQTLV
jgi:hypothetical protein